MSTAARFASPIASRVARKSPLNCRCWFQPRQQQLRQHKQDTRQKAQGKKSMARILVVDDEVGIRELLLEILRDEGHDVTLAENAAVARTAREMMRPDLVLLDIWMPDTDG